MLQTQKLTFSNSDFFAKSEIQNSITISKIMKLVQKLNSQQKIEHGGHFYWRHGYYLEHKYIDKIGIGWLIVMRFIKKSFECIEQPE